MDFDDRFELYHEDAARIWIWKLLKAAPSELAPWVSTYRDGRSCTIIDRLQGSFNVSYVVRFDEDGLCWVVRFPMPGRVMSLDEKTRAEVATMRFIKAKTSIPVPDIITWGLSAENPLQLGPWIIMEHIKGEPLNTFVEAPRTSGSSPILRPDIPPEDLEIIYRQWARWQLELSRHHFQCIGSMDDEYVPRFRPMTIKTNEIESHGGVRVACKFCIFIWDSCLGVKDVQVAPRQRLHRLQNTSIMSSSKIFNISGVSPTQLTTKTMPVTNIATSKTSRNHRHALFQNATINANSRYSARIGATATG